MIPKRCCSCLLLQVLQFFTYMGMPHPYKAPLLLVEGPVLEEYAGAWVVKGSAITVGPPLEVCKNMQVVALSGTAGPCCLYCHGPCTAVCTAVCTADREGRPRQPGASGPVFHIRGLCVAHVYK
jgi:hypothetical protein